MESLVLQRPHWDALTPSTQDAFHLLDKSDLIKRFYLAGGTGLALHFGHRSALSDKICLCGRSRKEAMQTTEPLKIVYD